MFIIIGFIALFIFGIIGITRVVDGLDLTDIVPRETQEYKFLEAQDKYFGFYNMYAVTKREFDYASPEGQKLLLDYHQGFQHVQQIIKKEDGTLPRFWLQLFRDWLLGKYIGKAHIDGLVQERRNSSALAMELRLSCTNPLISRFTVHDWCKSIANTLDIYIWYNILELQQFCAKPSIWLFHKQMGCWSHMWQTEGWHHIDGLMQKRQNSSAIAMEL